MNCLRKITTVGLAFVTTLLAEVPPVFMGDWQGSYINPPKGSWASGNPSLVGRIIGKADGRFEVQLMNVFERRAAYDVHTELKPEGGVLRYSDDEWAFTVEGEALTGTRRHETRSGEVVQIPFELKKVVRVSSTMGRLAPEGAESLIYPGLDNLDAWVHRDGKPASWKLLPGGVLEVYSKASGNPVGGHIYTKKAYADSEVHIEYKLPYMPEASGAHRANSGLFLQGNYEVQILDSYGVDSGWTDCGAIYKVAPSRVNRCAPPGQWQTFDITFTAARFDEAGTMTAYPRMTVLHNGRLIHNDVEVFELPWHPEVRRKSPHPDTPLPIWLQDHGQPVQFRNFWVKEL